jgi:hypothetical protein
MMIRRLSVGLACAGTLAAHTFFQMSNPRFGMFTKKPRFEHETVNLEFAIASANRLSPHASKRCFRSRTRAGLLRPLPALPSEP